ncbi:four helix bundle protein [Rubellicoccus peritrichatus]|uniref:Four helix bundle protein n=1 Tax=Rubellicoccus peritrichatus TaxID=3080537 RepID=A0AAQ3QS75_9BACT|nr:four helix bundle protein [Puniceicoccus sp. CR14]WOO42113.1 four helix bundle protein [Puniceicoccus sp. CR14]
MSNFFPHENAKVYQLALEWVIWIDPVIRELPSQLHTRAELDRLAASMVVQIADGVGKSNPSDRVKALESAKSTCLASAAIIDILGARNLLEQGDIANAKKKLSQIVRLLSGMVQSANTNEIIRSRLGASG